MKSSRSWSGLSIVLSALMLTGCACSRPHLQVSQQNLLAKCPPLPVPQGTTGADLLNAAIGAGHLYNECATRHNGLVAALVKPE